MRFNTSFLEKIVAESVWDSSTKGHNLIWRTLTNEKLQEICKFAYHLDSEITDVVWNEDVLNTHASNGFLLRKLAGSDLEFLGKLPSVSEASQYFNLITFFTYRFRYPYIIFVLSLIFFVLLVIGLISFVTFGCKSSRKSKARTLLKCLPWKLQLLTISVAYLVNILFIPLIVCFFINKSLTNVESGTYKSICHSHRLAHIFVYGTNGANVSIYDQYNPYNIAFSQSWPGVLELDKTVTFVENQFVSNKESIIYNALSEFDEKISTMQNVSKAATSALNKFQKTLSLTKQSLKENDTGQICVMCELIKTAKINELFSEANTTLYSLLNIFSDGFLYNNTYVEESLKKVWNFVAPFLNSARYVLHSLDGNLYSYFVILTNSEYLINDVISPVLSVLKYTIIGVTCVLAIVSLCFICPLLLREVLACNFSLKRINRYIRITWTALGFWQVILFLVTGSVALLASTASQPCVFFLDNLLIKGKYGDYPALIEYLAKVTEKKIPGLNETEIETDLILFAQEFVTFKGTGNIKIIPSIENIYETTLSYVSRYNNYFEANLVKLSNNLLNFENTLNLIKNWLDMYRIPVLIDFDSEVANNRIENEKSSLLLLPSEILISGITENSTNLNSSIKSLLESVSSELLSYDELLSVSDKTYVYGLIDVESALNKLLTNLKIPSVKSWCLQTAEKKCEKNDSQSYVMQATNNDETQQLISNFYKNHVALDVFEEAKEITVSKFNLINDFFKFNTSVKWTQKKLDLLNSNLFVEFISENNIKYLNYSDYLKVTGKQITLFTSTWIAVAQSSLEELRKIADRAFETLQTNLNQDVFLLPASFKQALVEITRGTDSVCLIVVEEICNFLVSLLILLLVNSTSLFLLYKIWKTNAIKQKEIEKQQRKLKSFFNKFRNNYSNSTERKRGWRLSRDVKCSYPESSNWG